MNLKIHHKMLLSFMIVILLTGAVSIFAIINLNKLDKATRIIAEKKFSAVIAERKLHSIFSKQVNIEKKYFIFRDKTYLNLFKQESRDFNAQLQEIKNSTLTDSEKIIADKIGDLHKEYHDIFEKKLKLLKRNKLSQIKQLKGKTESKANQILQLSESLLIVSEGIMDQKITESSELSRKASFISVIIFIIALIAGLVLAILITRNISKPIAELQSGTRQISEGKFDYQLKRTNRRDELDELFRVFNAMACKLKESEELKASFISMITHDLRNPLNIIQGYIETFIEGGAGKLQKDQTEMMQVMNQNASHILRLVRDLSDVSLIESNIFKVDLKGVDIKEIANTAVTQMSSLAKPKEMKIKLDCPSKIPPVNGDMDRLLQIMNNLLKNAIKYGPPKTTIKIFVKENKNDIMVQVNNTGEPIPKSELPFIFDKFRRTSQSRAGKVKGLGLGLFIVKTIIEAHHGKIWVESSKEKGTDFFFALPKKES